MHAPLSDWPYAVTHAVYLHDIMPNPITGMSPHLKRTGMEAREGPKTLEGVLFQKCYAKIYKHNKYEREAVDCIYLGYDPATSHHLVRKIGGKRTGKEVLSATVVSFDPTCPFPYANSEVPVPDPMVPCNYDSDSDQEENGIQVGDGREFDSTDEDASSESDEEDSDKDCSLKNSDNDCSLKNKLKYEPNDLNEEEDYDQPDGKIGKEEAWEIEAIVGEKMLGKRRNQRHYEVKWKGNYPNDWLHYRRVRAPEVIEAWKKKKEEELE